ncbi:MAG: hypothetical protein WB795_19715 [Candidatus Acidiferrales bacterium]
MGSALFFTTARAFLGCRYRRDFRRVSHSGRAFGDQDNGAADRLAMITQPIANVGSDRA